jgi:hypothetical protein
MNDCLQASSPPAVKEVPCVFDRRRYGFPYKANMITDMTHGPPPISICASVMLTKSAQHLDCIPACLMYWTTPLTRPIMHAILHALAMSWPTSRASNQAQQSVAEPLQLQLTKSFSISPVHGEAMTQSDHLQEGNE